MSRTYQLLTIGGHLPTQVKLVVACCFFLVALVSCTCKTVQLPFSLTCFTASGVIFFKFFFRTIADKKVGTRSNFSPPPTCNVYNQLIFSLFVEKNTTFSNID